MWLLLSAQLSFGQAVVDDGLIDPLGTDCGHPRTSDCLSRGDALTMGIESPRDDGMAAAWYAEACRHDSGVACEKLALQYQYGHGLPADPTQAVALMKQACTLGNARACGAMKRGLYKYLPKCHDGKKGPCRVAAESYQFWAGVTEAGEPGHYGSLEWDAEDELRVHACEELEDNASCLRLGNITRFREELPAAPAWLAVGNQPLSIHLRRCLGSESLDACNWFIAQGSTGVALERVLAVEKLCALGGVPRACELRKKYRESWVGESGLSVEIGQAMTRPVQATTAPLSQAIRTGRVHPYKRALFGEAMVVPEELTAPEEPVEAEEPGEPEEPEEAEEPVEVEEPVEAEEPAEPEEAGEPEEPAEVFVPLE